MRLGDDIVAGRLTESVHRSSLASENTRRLNRYFLGRLLPEVVGSP
jgi:hypothetical protein